MRGAGYRHGVYGTGVVDTTGTLFSGADVRNAPVLAWFPHDKPSESLRLACEDVKARREAGEFCRVVEQTKFGPAYPCHEDYFVINEILAPVAA